MLNRYSLTNTHISTIQTRAAATTSIAQPKESAKYAKNHTLTKKRFFALWLGFLALTGVILIPVYAHAGLFTQLLDIFSNDSHSTLRTDNSHLSLLTLPLIGSRVNAAPGITIPSTESTISLMVSQDTALIGTHNPLGTMADENTGQIILYTVQQGDIPGVIAGRFGISLDTLLWANNIRNPNRINVGDELIILPVTGIQHTVKKGDTISTIARKFNGEVEDILSFNGIGIDQPIKTGDILIIPNGELPTPSPTPTPSASRITRLPSHAGYYLRPIDAGRRSRGLHGYNGVDLADSCGLPVRASASGRVIVSRNSGWNGGYGRYIVISHENNTQTLYSHLTAAYAQAGQTVGKGDQIGTIGSTGNSTGCHIHFEIRGATNPF